MEFISLFWSLEFASRFFKNLCTFAVELVAINRFFSHDNLVWIAFGPTQLRG